MNNFIRNSILTKIPTKDTILEKFESLISVIEMDIFDDYMTLDNNELRRHYKISYEELISSYLKCKKIEKLKRELSFEELCEYYNNVIFAYKNAIKETNLDEIDKLNSRVSIYYGQLQEFKTVFKFKENINEGNV